MIHAPLNLMVRRDNLAQLKYDGLRKLQYTQHFRAASIARGSARKEGEMVKSSLFALALSLFAGEARADLIFSSTTCGGIASGCGVEQSHHPAVGASPLSDQAFHDFFTSHSISGNPTFIYGENGSSADFTFGRVYDFGLIDTQYINGKDGLICCITDEPFRLTGINSSNLLIGQDSAGSPFISFAGPLADFDYDTPKVIEGIPVGFQDQFIAIDDSFRILAQHADT